MKARTILLTLLCAVGMTAYANEKSMSTGT